MTCERRLPAGKHAWLSAVAVCLFALPFPACVESRADQPAPARQEKLAKRLIVTHKCGSCHTLQAQGLELKGRVGPDLTRQAARGRSSQWLEKQLLEPRSVPDHEVEPGFEGKQRLMPPLKASPEEVEALIAFLNSLD